jgi:hypothetical protein
MLQSVAIVIIIIIIIIIIITTLSLSALWLSPCDEWICPAYIPATATVSKSVSPLFTAW